MAHSAFAYKQIKEFYAEAGNGRQLYLLLTAIADDYSAMVENAGGGAVRSLLNYAEGKIKLLGVMCNDAVVYDEDVVVTHGINDDVYDAADVMGEIAETYFGKQQPFRAVIGGTSYNGTANALTDQLTGTTNNRVSILIGDTVTGAGACLGLLMGRLAKIPVERKVSRVKDGSLVAAAAYLGTSKLESKPYDSAIIHAAGYITLKKIARRSGYFFTGDHTLSVTTDDYHSLARGRVIDKAHVLAYDTYVNEVDDKIPTVAGGLPEPMWAKDFEAKVTKVLNENMAAKGEVIAVSANVPLDQVVIGEGAEFKVDVRLRPYGYLTDIEVTLGFEV